MKRKMISEAKNEISCFRVFFYYRANIENWTHFLSSFYNLSTVVVYQNSPINFVKILKVTCRVRGVERRKEGEGLTFGKLLVSSVLKNILAMGLHVEDLRNYPNSPQIKCTP